MPYYPTTREDEEFINRLFEQNEKSESEAENGSTAERRYSTAQTTHNKRYDDDDFWNLGETRRKVYQKPDFGDKPNESTLVDKQTEDTSGVKREMIPKVPPNSSSAPSKLYNRPADNTAINGKSVRTSRYGGKRPDVRAIQQQQNEALRMMETIKEYECENLLIRRVEIKPWTTNIQFYQRFAGEAALFHEKKGSPCEPAQFFAYVPQYSKMNDKQQNFYLYVRECIRNEKFIEADMSYLLLYIYEIINIPHLIPPAEGVKLLASIWLHYREAYPRLDVFLCEWLPDYCLIHQVPMPAELTPILPQIVQKAQFKEFYLDVIPDKDMTGVAQTLLEFSSDYDYRRSRYYEGNESVYEEKIRGAVTEALTAACRDKRGIFAFEKKYRLTRDAYCGAVTPAEIKRRIDVEFYSFTRPLETRKIITDLVKYAENKLRAVLKIKAKLGTGELDPADREIIDRFFQPMMPENTGSRAKAAAAEDEYLKYYEAESSGFDFGTAEEIEQMSWNNTNILTDIESAESSEEDHSLAAEPVWEEKFPECNEEAPVPLSVQTPADTPEYSAEKEALRAAEEGNFRGWCRNNGFFDSDMAAKINEIFLDLMGDIVLTDENGDYNIIEDYREDVLEWLN